MSLALSCAALLALTSCAAEQESEPDAAPASTTTSEPVDAPAGGGSELPLDASPTSEPSAGPAELAPSQVGAATVPAPETPPPCDPADLALWTARVEPSPGTEPVVADAVIRVRNGGDAWCEVDISGSPLVDPDIEPSVWLEAGAWADLVVGQSGDDCVDPTAILVVPVAVGATVVDVPTSMIAACGWELTAFFPDDPPTGPCTTGQLATTVVDGAVVVRNDMAACSLGALVVDGETGPGGVSDLAPGDIVAIDTVGWCPQPLERFDFELGAALELPEPACPVDGASVRPYFAGVDGPLTPFTSGALDVAGALAALDPFGGGNR